LCVPWIFRRLLLGSYFQWHQTASSSEFSSELKSKSFTAEAQSTPRKPFSTRSFCSVGFPL